MRTVAITLATALVATAGTGHTRPCQDSGVNQLSFVVPYKAGGGYDLYARTLAAVIEEQSDVRVKVSNVTSGSGTAAVSLVVGSDDSLPRIGIFNSRDLLSMLSGDRDTAADANELRFLGTVHVEGQVIVSRQDFELPPEDGSLVTPGTSLETVVLNTIIPLEAVGIYPQIVTGYDGSTEQTAALLRGEVDIDVMTLGSAIKATRNGDLKVLLSMSAGADPALPDVPYLYGEGGLFEVRSANWDDTRKAAAEENIRAAVALMPTYRLLATGKGTSDGVQSCLTELVGTALFSDEFAHQAQVAGRDITPLGQVETQDGLETAFAAYLSNRDLIRSLVARETN